MRDDGFPDDFVWGCSASSYQVEGAIREDERGLSIWDEFSHAKGTIRDGSNGDIACDSYHRYPEDIALLSRLKANAYRFSIAWPRIQAGGRGTPNQKGLDHYSRFVDALLEKNIEPWPTLYHWDLPLELQKKGGWAERDTAYRFAEYAEIMFRCLGSRVKHWTSVNEPWCSAFLGYREGEHAPGLRDPNLAYKSVHHLLLAHGLADQAFRQGGMQGDFGIVVNPATPRPANDSEECRQAAHRASLERTALWFDPVFGRGYPNEYVRACGAQLPIEAGDMDLISLPVDFVGLNYYLEDTVVPALKGPDNPLGYRIVSSGAPKTEMGWEIVPQGLQRLICTIAEEWKPKALYVTENGAAFHDFRSVQGGTEFIHDAGRIAYLRDHLHACRDAIALGAPLKGYFVWSLLDNFEWAWGLAMKFGLVAVDEKTQERIPKDSFAFYRDAIAGSAL